MPATAASQRADGVRQPAGPTAPRSASGEREPLQRPTRGVLLCPAYTTGHLDVAGLFLCLTVGARGDCLARFVAVARLCCRGGRSVRVQIAGTTDWCSVDRSGTFAFALRKNQHVDP